LFVVAFARTAHLRPLLNLVTRVMFEADTFEASIVARMYLALTFLMYQNLGCKIFLDLFDIVD
jgi:hypothetical protein